MGITGIIRNIVHSFDSHLAMLLCFLLLPPIFSTLYSLELIIQSELPRIRQFPDPGSTLILEEFLRGMELFPGSTYLS